MSQTKTSKTSAVPAPVPAATKAAKAVSAPTPAPAPEPVKPVAAAPAVDVQEASPIDDITQRFTQLVEKLVLLASITKDLQGGMKTLQKDVAKLSKVSAKKGRAANKSATKRSPSGFAKPTPLSNELCDFLGLTHGSQKARTEVTRMLNDYIKKNSLQDQTDKRTINADAALRKLMQLKADSKLTYFNLQTYIKHHFVKA